MIDRAGIHARNMLALAFSVVIVAAACGATPAATPAGGAPAATAARPASAAPAAPAASAAPLPPIRLGVIQAMTGGGAYYGLRLSQGIQIAVDTINDEGGILGRKVQYSLEDTGTVDAQTPALLRKVAADASVPVVIGPSQSSNYLAALAVAEQLKVPWVSAASGAPWPQGLPNDWNFRNTVPFIDMVSQFMKAVIPALGAKKVASIYSPDNTGVASPQQIGSDTIKALGGVDQSTVLTAPTGTKDFGPQITKIIEANPDAVIVNLVTADGAAFMKQARDRGLKAKFIAGHNGLLDLNILKLSSGAAEGLIVPSHFDPNDPNPQTKKFVDAWTKKFGPLEDLISSYSWDMIFTIKAVMEKAGTATDRQKIRDTWGATENLCLAGGCYTWKGKGDRTNATVFPVVLGSAGFVKFTK